MFIDLASLVHTHAHVKRSAVTVVIIELHKHHAHVVCNRYLAPGLIFTLQKNVLSGVGPAHRKNFFSPILGISKHLLVCYQCHARDKQDQAHQTDAEDR